MAERSEADDAILAIADDLTAMQERLGDAYWQDTEAHASREDLRRRIGQYNAWAEDRLPMHQRARKAAEYESRFAHLLWPGRGSGP